MVEAIIKAQHINKTNSKYETDGSHGILNRVRIGSETKADISALRSRLTSGISNPIDVSQPPFVNALRLLPFKEQVEEYNEIR